MSVLICTAPPQPTNGVRIWMSVQVRLKLADSRLSTTLLNRLILLDPTKLRGKLPTASLATQKQYMEGLRSQGGEINKLKLRDIRWLEEQVTF